MHVHLLKGLTIRYSVNRSEIGVKLYISVIQSTFQKKRPLLDGSFEFLFESFELGI